MYTIQTSLDNEVRAAKPLRRISVLMFKFFQKTIKSSKTEEKLNKKKVLNKSKENNLVI